MQVLLSLSNELGYPTSYIIYLGHSLCEHMVYHKGALLCFYFFSNSNHNIRAIYARRCTCSHDDRTKYFIISPLLWHRIWHHISQINQLWETEEVIPALKKGNHLCLSYRKISNISRTKSPNLNVSRLVLQLSVPNPMKPDVKSRMKM